MNASVYYIYRKNPEDTFPGNERYDVKQESATGKVKRFSQCFRTIEEAKDWIRSRDHAAHIEYPK